jgi:hypothetical protein
MNNSSIVRLHREVIVLSGAESCFLNNLAIRRRRKRFLRPSIDPAPELISDQSA